jgi:hypothetical protein
MKRKLYTSKNTLTVVRTAFVILFLVIGSRVAGQAVSADKQISGTVKFQEDNEPAPGVNIYLKGATAQGTYSDAKGHFQFPRTLKTGDVLVFSFIGRKSIEYIVTDHTIDPIEIVMDPEHIEMVEDVLVEGNEPSRTSVFARLFRKEK